MITDEFKHFKRSQVAELRPYIEGEALSERVSISVPDKENGSPKQGDMIARNPANHDDQWLIAKDYFEANFENGDNFNYLTESARTVSASFHGHFVSLSEMRDAFALLIEANKKIDRIKKLLFYGQDAGKKRFVIPFDGYNSNQAIDKLKTGAIGQPVRNETLSAELILHAVLGCVTESVEMLEMLDGVIFHSKEFDAVNLIEESGDLQWYEAILCRVFNTTFDDVQRLNIAKLRERYPDKFTSESANERDLDAERAVLEKG